MTWHCHIFAVLALAFSACFQQGLASAINVTEPVPVARKICDTRQCVLSAAYMINNMNETADPCEDFNEFACGRYIKEKEFPPGHTFMASYSAVHVQNMIVLRNIILEESSPSHPKYLRLIKSFYQSCMDEAEIEVVGLQPYFNDTESILDWPTLNPHWTEANFDLNEVIARYMTVGIAPIFSVNVGNDLSNTTNNIIYLNEGRLEMSQEVLIKERNDSVIMAYEKYLAEAAIALNASREVAEEDARDVVDLEIELSKIMVSRADKRDYSKLLNPVLLKDLGSDSDTLDIARALRTTFDTVNITLANNEKINNLYPTYMGNLSSVLKRFSNRTIQNLFGFQYTLLRVDGLTQKLRDIKHEYIKVALGAATRWPRNDVCIYRTSSAFWKGLSKQYVLRKFPHTAKTYLNKMIDNLMKEFHGMIEEVTWMSNKTKVGAFAKLASMKRDIGYPDEDFEDSDIDRFYEDYTMNEKEYYNNNLIQRKQARLLQRKTLRQPSSKNQWEVAPYDVNAMYTPNRNAITFLAGILQPPFFLESYQHYLNYGFMGFVIGHEITHGFDDQGSQFDKDGNVRNWWTEEDRQNFKKRAKCIVDQTSNVNVVEVNITLNGINTQGESIADRGGLKESFRAYQRKVKHCGVEPTLPGLKLTQDQLFFLSFAQFLCEKRTPERLKNQLESGNHVPGKYRIYGALQNSEEFAKAYNCPVGSFMNPAEKCSVW